MNHNLGKSLIAPAFGAAALCLSGVTLHAQAYKQTNLVSDVPGLAANFDANLVNPWGIATSPTSPFWLSDAGTGKSTLYNTAGTPQGLAIGTVSSKTFLYAANFGQNEIDVFDSTGAMTLLPGHFVDPTLPAGYAPFNVQNIGGSLFVTYALKGASGEDEAGVGHGFVDKFDLNGNLVTRLASGGVLNSPWGLAQAPTSFGIFGGDLLVGNFGDGTINAFDPVTGTYAGTIKDGAGNPLVNEGLWGLQFGNGGNGGSLGTLYFAAGIDDETHGLFGAIAPVPEPATTSAFAAAGLVGLCLVARLRRRGNKVAVTPALQS